VRMPLTIVAVAAVATLALTSSALSSSSKTQSAFIKRFKTVTQIASTVPANGDVNPYGVAVVTQSTGHLVAGDTLVSNYNAKSNVQGTGTTIVQVSPSGHTTLFAHVTKLPAGMRCPGGIGFSTALSILPNGFVVVGSFPSTKGGALPTAKPAGCLIVLSSSGKPVETLTNKQISGPWDMAMTASSTKATLFVSNGMTGTTKMRNGTPFSGKCTVARLELTLSGGSPPKLTKTTVIGKDFPWIANKPTFILSETGLALGHNGTLYVDNTETNTVSAITHALTSTKAVTQSASTITSRGSLSAPLGMTLAPNGDLIVDNGNNGNLVEITPAGKQIATVTLVKKGAGDLFGLAVKPGGKGILFVNDGANTLDLDH
jgi:hypothetical protein